MQYALSLSFVVKKELFLKHKAYGLLHIAINK